jgi:4'-phosphopantetheinyl transferase
MTAGIDLWLVDLERAAPALEAVEATTPRLSEDLRRRLSAMGDAAASRERRLAHIALRIALEARLGASVRGAPFSVSTTGKPSLAEDGAGFSLAHTHGLALIAVGDGPVGVDIERWRPVRVPVIRRPSIEAEAIELAAGAPLVDIDADARFINAWVRVEAVAKALGCGVAPILERLRPGKARPPADVEREAANGIPFVAHDVPVAGGVFAAIALAGQPRPELAGFPEAAATIEALLASRARTRR